MISVKGRMEIEKRLDEIIGRAQQIVNDTGIANKGMKVAQLRNLLEFTSATNSIKAVEIFIQYQMGRKDTKRAWAESGFGNKLILEEIKAIEATADEISNNTKDGKKEIQIEILKYYVGYLNRYFVYVSSGEGEKEG